MNSSERDDVFKFNFNDYTLIVTGSIQIHFHERGVKIQKIVSKLTVYQEALKICFRLLKAYEYIAENAGLMKISEFETYGVIIINSIIHDYF